MPNNLRYYQTQNNLGGAIGSLLYTSPVDMISTPSTEFVIESGYTNQIGNSGQLVVVDNVMTFNGGASITATEIGTYILFNADGNQQCVVDVTSISPLITVTLDFILSSLVNDLFNPIDTTLAINGGDRYRCIAIKNDSLLSFQGGKIWIKTDISEGSISIGFDATNTDTSDGVVAPSNVTFGTPQDETNGLVIPTLNADSHINLWIRRTNPANTSDSVFYFTLEESGSYV